MLCVITNARPFVFKGVTFTPYAILYKERNQFRLLTNSMISPLIAIVPDYNYSEFYTVAKKTGQCVDFYKCNDMLVIPCNNGFARVQWDVFSSHFKKKGTLATATMEKNKIVQYDYTH